MITVLLGIVLFSLSVLLMCIGPILGGRRIEGSCGGLKHLSGIESDCGGACAAGLSCPRKDPSQATGRSGSD